MDSVIEAVVPAAAFNGMIDQEALMMPVTVYGKPIGFISGVTDKVIKFTLWTKDMSFLGMVNDEGEKKFLQLELCENFDEGEGEIY